ncbi:unnamed protein product [Notodromas monacha]|uniref:Uncharacterized protein n=1 Tax=Notodromas monacha TaxID=399045 RepID=A0A7R9BMG8_9CRUS|nr:unnamed protein product [Notodromas monacha]CAG0916717.1 unnamed protein product [Notodromas monacha]
MSAARGEKDADEGEEEKEESNSVRSEDESVDALVVPTTASITRRSRIWIPVWTLCLLALMLLDLVSGSVPCPKEGCLCVAKQVTCSGAGLTEFPKNIFVDVESLSFVRNKIKRIPQNYFKQFKKLKRLYLDKNVISEVPAHFLEGLPSGMDAISLQDNKLRFLAPFSFGGIRDVGDISLQKNELRAIKEFAFAGTTHVNMLMLGGNPMQRIDGWAFSGLTDVNFLELPRGIGALAPDAFHGLHRVGFMPLAGLNLTELRANVFRELRNVSVLSLVDSSVGNVAVGSLDGVRGVQNLDVFNNTFLTFEELRIGVESEVQALKVEGNSFKGIGVPGLIHFRASRSLSVSGNTFPCDCRIHRILKEPPEGFADTNYCNAPVEVAGMTIKLALNVTGVERCPEDLVSEPTSSSSQYKASAGDRNFLPRLTLTYFLLGFLFITQENVLIFE